MRDQWHERAGASLGDHKAHGPPAENDGRPPATKSRYQSRHRRSASTAPLRDDVATCPSEVPLARALTKPHRDPLPLPPGTEHHIRFHRGAHHRVLRYRDRRRWHGGAGRDSHGHRSRTRHARCVQPHFAQPCHAHAELHRHRRRTALKPFEGDAACLLARRALRLALEAPAQVGKRQTAPLQRADEVEQCRRVLASQD